LPAEEADNTEKNPIEIPFSPSNDQQGEWEGEVGNSEFSPHLSPFRRRRRRAHLLCQRGGRPFSIKFKSTSQDETRL